MRETINRDKVGTTQYQAHVQYLVPLDSPTALGNAGLEGYDEGTESRTFDHLSEAQEWALSWQPETGRADAWLLDRIEWTPDEYDDDTYGVILDATANVAESWYWDISSKSWEPM